MKYIESRMGKIILMICWIAYLFFCIQPVHTMAATNNNYTVEDDIGADTPSIIGESGIVMEVSTGTILFEKNIHDTHYPASITKIMTALLAIENCEMDEIVTVPPEAVYMEDKGTHIALDAGEQLTVEECLYAILLASANDAAYALAEHVGGTYENFICMMNAKAKEIGCQNTNFTNPHGLPDENHVTSAYDMALITRAALQYDMFQTVSGAFYYEIPPTEHQKDLICMNNHHKMIGKTNFHNEEVFAGKNGYTNAAGHTLVTCAICIDFKKNRIRIHRSTLRQIGNPEYIQLLVNPSQKMIAIKASCAEDKLAHKVKDYFVINGNSYELYSRELLYSLSQLNLSWEKYNIFRLEGNIYPDNKIALFSMDNIITRLPQVELKSKIIGDEYAQL